MTHFQGILSIAMVASVMSMAETAAAQSRSDTNRMVCAAARTLVAQQGGVVLATGPSLFDRYVSSRAACLSTQIIEPAYVPTADNQQCFVGYNCKEPSSGSDR
jgi:hypothetical protein